MLNTRGLQFIGKAKATRDAGHPFVCFLIPFRYKTVLILSTSPSHGEGASPRQGEDRGKGPRG